MIDQSHKHTNNSSIIKVAEMDSDLITKKRSIVISWPLDIVQTHDVVDFSTEMALRSRACIKARIPKEDLPDVLWMDGLKRPHC